MYGPLFVSRFSALGHLTPPQHSIRPSPSYQNERSELPVRCERFLRHLNAALDLVIPPLAPQWMVDTKAQYGMLACNIYVSSIRNGRAAWPIISSSPLISVLFAPHDNPQVQVTPIGRTPQEHTAGELLARSLRTALADRGGYSVAGLSTPRLESLA